ncbi:EAL domain-containing protein [Halorhodospira abdelmalekii]|uniref:EAL domain-containing protein n=1 Tax=Halorhodospira abdelmalekii TaxID=421629 RepID=UPI0019059B53
MSAWWDRQKRALAICGGYVCGGLVWISGSDAAVALWAPADWVVPLQAAKGALFVVATAALLWWLLARLEHRGREGERLLSSAQQAQRKSALYAALSEANHAVMEVREREVLFSRICQIVVDHTGVRLAWIGLIEPAERWVEPAAWAGDSAGERYLGQIRVSSDPARPEGRGPVGRAIASQHSVIFGRFLEEQDAAPWHRAAREAGFGAVAAFPLLCYHEVVGALAVYADDAGYFDDDVTALLEDLVADVGFAVEYLEREAERQRQEARIRYLAEHDLMTGLLNREAMSERIARVLGACARRGERSALLFLNLDRFRVINDAFGHHAGDELLRAAAARFSELLSPSIVAVGRQGADEFLFLFSPVDAFDEVAEFAERLLAELRAPLVVNGVEHIVTPSIGVALFPDDAAGSGVLLRNAEAAMQAAKSGGRNRYCRFTADMHRSVQERIELEASLRGAEQRGELELWYQPQIDIASNRLVGAEALMRWRHPEWGLVSPGRFIPVAEESGLIVSLGDWAIEEACRQRAEWAASGLLDGPLAVNVSALQLSRSELAATVARALERHGLAASALQLEMTESLFFQDNSALLATLNALQAYGLRLAVDDFGTGYSNLGYLKRLPLAKLKIDQSFIRDLPGDAEDAVITRTIVNMAIGLNLRVIAEGVETTEQLAYLRQIGCHEAQGFLFGRPQPAEQFAESIVAAGWASALAS